MDFNEDDQIYTYPCPCGDKFEISVVCIPLLAQSDWTVDIFVLTFFSIQDELRDGEDVARCPSCSLIIRVIFDPDDFQDEEEGETTFTIDTSITVS